MKINFTVITGDIKDIVIKVMTENPDKKIYLVHGCNSID